MFQVFAVALLASVAQGHMLMNFPTPYTTPKLHNGPLQADGSDFPCQLTSGVTLAGAAANTFALGSSQELNFTGQAVHGGGSCQVSITYDENPTKDSVWKVIRSIEGGCPARGESGNMGDDSTAADPYTYSFDVPDNIPAGKVTLAWTWFNKIGNREMYMNCAPVTLTGTSGSVSNFNSLPDMFVANVGNGCGTVDSTDLLFPNPGADVVSLNGATSAFSTPTGTGCQAAGAAVATAASVAAGTTTAAAPTTTAAAAAGTTATSSSSVALAGGVFVTVASVEASKTAAASSPTTFATSVAVSVAKFSTVATVATAATTAASSPKAKSTTTTAAAAATSSASSTTTTSGSSGTTQTPGSACSTEGAWNCLTSGYQRCASGVWTVVMPMAAGTECTSSGATSFNINAISSKARRSSQARRIPRRFRA